MSFVVVGKARAAGAASRQADAGDAAPEIDIAGLVQAEINRLRAAAEADGRAHGEAAARAAAEADSVRLRTGIAALRDAWTQLAAPLARKEHDLAELVTELSFVLAQHIIGVEVTLNANGLKTMVAKLIEEAAAERGPRQTVIVRLHPADHALIDPLTKIDNAHLLSDVAVTRGGAMVEIIAPDGDPIDRIVWDASIEARVATMRNALGLDDAFDREAAPGAAP
jgi:flagellar assembly protein FliH